ncbi:MAG: NAD-dependent epimerase/dehydratase family protein [Acetobacteraceae bacterium]
MTKRVLLTGATGFVGSALADILTRTPGVALTLLTHPSRDGREDRPHLTADLTNTGSVAEALSRSQPEFIVHAAGRVQGNALQLFSDNTVTTVALADAIREAAPRAVLIALGSAAEYGRSAAEGPVAEDAPLRPSTVYGHAKVAAGAYLAASAGRGLRYSLLRVFNLIGQVNTPAQVVGAFISKATPLYSLTSPRVVELGRLDAVRDFITLNDLGRVIVRLIDRGDWGHVLNVCSGEGRRVRDLITFLVHHSGRDYKIIERGDPPTAEDVFIGDPTRLRALVGRTELESVEAVLADAWSRALMLQDALTEERGAAP